MEKILVEEGKETCEGFSRRVALEMSTWWTSAGRRGDGKTHAQSPTHTRVHSPDKGSAISGCLQSAAPPLVPPVSAVRQNKCLTLSENPPATANRAPPSICCVHAV